MVDSIFSWRIYWDFSHFDQVFDYRARHVVLFGAGFLLQRPLDLFEGRKVPRSYLVLKGVVHVMLGKFLIKTQL